MSKAWQQLEKEFIAACTRLGLPVEVRYAPFQDNVPDDEMDSGSPHGMTQHETANPNVGADARAQRNWVAVHHGGGSPNLASFTMSTDDKRCVLICRLNYRNNHAGKVTGNSTHGSNELCVNADGNWAKAKDNAAKADAAYLYVNDLPLTDLTLSQHNRWTGKNCPQRLRERGEWPGFKGAVGTYLQALKADQPPPPPPQPVVPTTHEYFPQTGYSIGHGIRDYFNQNGGVGEFGYPRTEEYDRDFDGQPYRVQIFERGALVWNPRTGEVTRGLLGSWYVDVLAELEQLRKATQVPAQ